MLPRTVLLTAASLLLGCAAAGTHLSPPESVRPRADHAHIELGSLSGPGLHDALPRALARVGYFITTTQARPAAGTELMTDWQPTDARTRTRLIISTRPRGERFAVTIYAVSFVEDEAGSWREVRASRQVQTMLRDISLQLTSSAVRAGARP